MKHFRRLHQPVSLGMIAAAGVSMLAVVPAPAARAAGASRIAAPPAPSAVTSDFVRSCAIPTAPNVMACMVLHRTDVREGRKLAPLTPPLGYGPADLQSAYKLPVSAGSGHTVAIVDAYDDPAAESDLAVYRSQYGLPPCTTANGCFSKLNQAGAASPLPSSDSTWDLEISLDLDMVSATCPQCHILLVEASNADDGPLYAAEDIATARAKYVSNSWGRSENSGQTSDDSHFNHPGVAITAASGDGGYAAGALYPASSKYVTAVGGTSLTSSSNARGWAESAWSNAGTGCSLYDTIPFWQEGIYTGPLCSMRADADVSAVADPNSGVAMYDSIGGTYSNGVTWSGWTVSGGTSAAAPIIASVYALAGVPGASDDVASDPYERPGLFDVTSGNDGSCGIPTCTAGTGWDGPTGLGTPDGVNAFSDLTVTQGDESVTAGAAASLASSVTGGTGPFTWSAAGLPAGLSIDPSTGIISGTPTTVGNSTVVLYVTDAVGATSQGSFVITVQVRVPDVVELTVSSASAALSRVGLALGARFPDYSCSGRTGTVTDQFPSAGTPVAPGSTVDVDVAEIPPGGVCR